LAFVRAEGKTIMNDASRSETDLAMKCYASFMFAFKAIGVGINYEFSSAEYMKIWSIVNEVAEGKQTLNVSPSELTMSSPEMLPAMRGYIQETQAETMKREQAVAKMLVAVAAGFVARDDPSK
jgi:hypothetical protein